MSKSKTVSPFLPFLLVGSILVAGVFGWIANIVKLASIDVFSGIAILRAIGVFVAPLGSVLGFV